MPLDPDASLPTLFPTARDPVLQQQPQEIAAPGMLDMLGASARDTNSTYAAFTNKTMGVDNTPDKNFNVGDAIVKSGLADYEDRLVDANNPEYFEALTAQIRQEQEDDITRSATPWYIGVPMDIVNGIADIPVTLATGALYGAMFGSPQGGAAAGAVASAGKVTAAVARRSLAAAFGKGAAVVGGSVALSEGLLHASQETRTMEESAFNIGAGTLLGGLLGAGAHALLTPAERKIAEKATEEYFHGGKPQSGGAAANPFAPEPGYEMGNLTREQMRIQGGGVEAVARATAAPIPNLRSFFRADPYVTEVMQNLTQHGLISKAAREGEAIAPGGAAETLINMTLDSRIAAVESETTQIYREMKKAGITMSREEFGEAYIKAARRGDKDPANEYVTRAAQVYRSRFATPFLEDGARTGLRGFDVSSPVVGAESHVHRAYNQKMLRGEEEFKFKQAAAGDFREWFKAEHTTQSETALRRVHNIDKEVADLQLDPATRAATIADLEAKGAALDAAHPDVVERLGDLKDLRIQIKAQQDIIDKQVKWGEPGYADAVNAADAAKAKIASLKEEMASVQEQGGDRFRSYLAQRRELRGRHKRVDLGYAGLQERQQKIQQSLVDIETKNESSLQRLVLRGRKFEREAARLDPEKYAARVEATKSSFAELARKYDNSVERITKMIDDLRGKADAEGTVSPEDAAFATKLEKELKLQQTRAAAMTKTSKRLEDLEAFDPIEALAEVKKATDELVAQQGGRALTQGEKAQRLLDRYQKLDPEKVKEKINQRNAQRQQIIDEFNEKWGRDTFGAEKFDDAKIRYLADDAADDYYNSLTGKQVDTYTQFSPSEYATSLTRGPLKGRTPAIKDATVEPWLINDPRTLMERQGRALAADIFLTQKFGRADMRDQFAEVAKRYAERRANVSAAATLDEAVELSGRTMDDIKSWLGERVSGKAKPTKEDILQYLHKDEKDALDDMAALRDVLRGTYAAELHNTGYASVIRQLKAFNYLRISGSFGFANLAEAVYRPAMVYGLRRYMEEGLKPLISNLSALKIAAKEGNMAGLITERATLHRTMSLNELSDRYASGSLVDRTLRAGSNFASKWNGIALITDAAEFISTTLAQNEILEAVSGKIVNEQMLGDLGISKAMRKRITAEFEKHGDIFDKTHVANSERWTDLEAQQAFRAALAKRVNNTITKPSVGDIPLAMHRPIGGAIGQFQRFMFAAHQRVMLRGLQESKANFISGVIGLTTLGIMIDYLQAARSDEDTFKRWLKSAENPGFLIGNGLDRSGVMPMFMQISNTIEKLGQSVPGGTPYNPIKSPLLAAFPGETQQGRSSRFSQRDVFSTIFGPSAQIPTDIARAMGFDIDAGLNDKSNNQSRKALGRLIPFVGEASKYPGVPETRKVIDLLFDDQPNLRH